MRHGDIPFHGAKLPKGAKKVAETKEFTFGYGEKTGHNHTFVADKNIAVFESGGNRYIVVSEATIVKPTHPEHRSFEVPAGTYRQFQEVEYDPFEKVVRDVID